MSKLFVQPLYHETVPDFVAFAKAGGYNLEVATFAYANVYDTNWGAVLQEHQRLLAGFGGQVSLHGVYEDVNVYSNDPKIAALSRERIQSSVKVAQALNADKIVFHGAVNPLVLGEWYRKNWVEKNVAFWQTILQDYAGTVLLENVWEPDPSVFRSLLNQIGSPRLKICFDIAHAHVYSRVSVENWLDILGQDIVYMHFSDNSGQTDQHAAIGTGKIDWQTLTRNLQTRSLAPEVVLEECTLERTQASIDFMKKNKIYPF